MKKILIIEDDLDIQEMPRFLEDQDYQVVAAGDGVEGISAFNKEKPDLVLLDILLPQNRWICSMRTAQKRVRSSCYYDQCIRQ